MPDILIRVEMPGSCAACDFYNVISGRCTRTGTKINFSELTTRSVDCPISELPPHGDLILKDDAIAVAKIMSDLYPQYRKVLAIVWDQIKDSPVIVPEERSEG